MSTDTLRKYHETYQAIRIRRHWSAHEDVFRVSALCIAGLDLEDPEEDLERTAAVLRKRAGWTSPLRSFVRYSVAALILQKRASATKVHAEVERVRGEFRKLRFPRGGVHEIFAAFLLALEHGGKRVPLTTLKRMRSIHTQWKDDHPFITGPDDYPMAALHALHEHEPFSLGERVEAIYQELRAAGFGAGNALQLASHVLAIAPAWEADEAAGRFLALSWAFKDRSFRVSRRHFDEIALLSLLGTPPAPLAEAVMETHAALRETRPKPGKNVAFSLAVGLTLRDEKHLGGSPAIRGSDSRLVLATTEPILQAQQAAVVAGICASLCHSGYS